MIGPQSSLYIRLGSDMGKVSRRLMVGFTAALGLGLAGCAKDGGGASGTPTSSQASVQASAVESGPPLIVEVAPQQGEGSTVEIAPGVNMTLPSALGSFTDDGSSRRRARYYEAINSFGLIVVDTSTFKVDAPGMVARGEWKASKDQVTTLSALVETTWPGAEYAWTWTWTQAADASVFDPESKAAGTVTGDGAALLMRTTGGQDLYIVALAPQGEFEGSAPLAALESLTISG